LGRIAILVGFLGKGKRLKEKNLIIRGFHSFSPYPFPQNPSSIATSLGFEDSHQKPFANSIGAFRGEMQSFINILAKMQTL
jgi:hypothetical protein